MMYDSEVEEVQMVQKIMKDTSAEFQVQAQEKRGDAMEIGDIEDLHKLFISPAEKFMDEFDGNSKDLKGLFKIPVENKFEVNLHQQVCNTSKNQYDSTNGECYLHGLVFTEDEQIGNWVSRTNEVVGRTPGYHPYPGCPIRTPGNRGGGGVGLGLRGAFLARWKCLCQHSS